MSNSNNDNEREELALEALIAAAFNDERCDEVPPDLDTMKKALTDEDRAALDALGANLIKNIFAGDKKEGKRKAPKLDLQTSLNRSDDDDPPSDKAKEEMERRIEESEAEDKSKHSPKDRDEDSGHD